MNEVSQELDFRLLTSREWKTKGLNMRLWYNST